MYLSVLLPVHDNDARFDFAVCSQSWLGDLRSCNVAELDRNCVRCEKSRLSSTAYSNVQARNCLNSVACKFSSLA